MRTWTASTTRQPSSAGHNALGLLDLQVWPRAGKLRITFDPEAGSVETYRSTLRSLGFPAPEGLAAPERPRVWRDPKVLTSAASGVIVLATWRADCPGAPGAVTLAPYLASAVLGGRFFGREAIEELSSNARSGSSCS